jgi:hypothetical protein
MFSIRRVKPFHAALNDTMNAWKRTHAEGLNLVSTPFSVKRPCHHRRCRHDVVVELGILCSPRT